MAILYPKILLFMLAAIFACFFAGIIFFTIGQCNRGQLTAAIKTINTYTYAGY
jgi:hypothetical protein